MWRKSFEQFFDLPDQTKKGWMVSPYEILSETDHDQDVGCEDDNSERMTSDTDSSPSDEDSLDTDEEQQLVISKNE